MKKSIFVSYSTKDKFFAELLLLKLTEAGVSVWLDRDELIAGDDWRQAIDDGIDASVLVIVVLSPQSCASHYVTYEWATGLAKEKIIIPILVADCDRHPKLEPIQYLDFKNHTGETWQKLISRVNDALEDTDAQARDVTAKADSKDLYKDLDQKIDDRLLTNKIVGYMNRHGYRMLSYKRIMQVIDKEITKNALKEFTTRSVRFREAKLSGGNDGLAIR